MRMEFCTPKESSRPSGAGKEKTYGEAGIVEANCDSIAGEPGLVARLSHAGGKE